jgi:hypothetical protein
VTTDTRVDVPNFIAAHQTDPLTAPRLAELAIEYTTRYGGDAKQTHGELLEYAAQEFAHPGGALIVTTGWRQPEAVALYLAAGYTPLYDRSLRSEESGRHPFEKLLAGAASHEASA